MVFIAMFLSIVGCVNNVSELEEVFTDNNEPYEIIYYFVYNNANPPQDVSTVQTKLNAVLKKKINATIKIYAYTLAEYTSKVSGVVAANAKFDVCFTSPEINPYLTNVQREAFLPLDYLLPTYAPETWKAIPAKIWDQARINGKMYGSVNEQIFPRTYAFNATSAINLQSFLDEKHSGIKAESVNTLNLNAFTFLEEYMQWLKSNNRGNNGKVSAIHTESALQNLFGYDNLGTGMSTPGVVQVKDNNFTVVNQFDTDDYKKIVDTSYDWKNKGYLDDSAAGYDLTPDSNWKPGYLTGNLIRLSETNYFTSYVIGTMNAISSTSKNPARAMKFIELMRTDEEVHNLLQFGIEDIHYIKDPNNSNRIAEFISGSGYDNRNFGWGLGCEFTSYLIAGQDDNLWKQVKEINDNTEMSELIGFNFDASSVKQKIADCKAVVNEYLSAFEYAQYKDKDAKLLEFKQRLKAAGADEIIAEKQRQLNEFLAKKA
jgi:putative aldouronate transport system substrate-binding protein